MTENNMTKTMDTNQEPSSKWKQFEVDVKLLWNAPEAFFKKIGTGNRIIESGIILGLIILINLLIVGVYYSQMVGVNSAYLSEFKPSYIKLFIEQVLEKAILFGGIYMTGVLLSQKKSGEVAKASVAQYFALYAYGSIPVLLALVPAFFLNFSSLGIFRVLSQSLTAGSCVLIALGIGYFNDCVKAKNVVLLSTLIYFLYELSEYISGFLA